MLQDAKRSLKTYANKRGFTFIVREKVRVKYGVYENWYVSTHWSDTDSAEDVKTHDFFFAGDKVNGK